MTAQEKELIERAKAGDRRAFDRLVTENRDKMFALTLKMTGDREAALDLTQETFLTAYKNIGGFRGEAGFGSWLYRIAANKSINYLRRRKLVSFIPLGGGAEKEAAYEMPDNPDRDKIRTALDKAVTALPPKQKLVFSMRFHEQMPFARIAGILGKSESTVKNNYRKAVEKLRKSLKDFR